MLMTTKIPGSTLYSISSVNDCRLNLDLHCTVSALWTSADSIWIYTVQYQLCERVQSETEYNILCT